MKMKISLITTHNANNYGAILQTFATQEVLKQYGTVTIINYENKHLSISLNLVRFLPTVHGLLGVAKDIFRLLPRYRVLKRFQDFFDEYFILSSLVKKDHIESLSESYDVYVAGSDQIWNPACVSKLRKIDSVYFLGFVPNEKIKISYASSMGGYKYSESEAVAVKELLSGFDSISVREKDTKNYLENILGRRVEHVLDPTLLLSKEQWLNSLGIQRESEPERYILFYCVPKLQGIREIAKYYREKLGIKLIALDQGLSSGVKVDKHIRDAGPREFIALFENAEFIITDSFHGTCFSINFGKPFVVYTEGMHSNRIKSILEITGLKHRLLNSAENTDCLDDLIGDKGLKEGLVKLADLRKNSLEFFDQALIPR
jgi:hypothetical protein